MQPSPSINLDILPYGCEGRSDYDLILQGSGLFYDDDGNLYEGEWIQGKRHGQGRAVYGGRAIDAFGGDVYEGHWENDLRCFALCQ